MIELLLEVKKARLLNQTDAARKLRAKINVRTRPPTITKLSKDLSIYEYNFMSTPSTEGKRHWGYVLYNTAKKDIVGAWCDCKDYAYRLAYVYDKNKLRPRFDRNLPNKYLKKVVVPYTRKPAVKTNPTNKLYACKHLSAMLSYIRE